ncbi:MAG: MFS transporter [Cellulomonas sp.]|nr:MFS transporter [Cellulomonas sp.]
MAAAGASSATAVRRTGSPRASSRRVRVSSVVVALGFVSLLTDISSEAVSAVLPLFITGALGMSTLTYGFVDGLMQGATALVRVVGGWASDRGDHPKWVAFLGYGVSALTRAGLLLASGFLAITALVAVDRVGKGMRTAPRDAMIAASSDPRTLGRSFGVHRTFDTVGAALGPLAAFVVLWAIPNGYRTVFVISFGCAVLGLAVLGLMVPDLRPRRAAWLERHRVREERGLPKCKGCTCDLTALAPGGKQSFSWRFLTEPGVRRLMGVAGLLALLTVGDGFVYLSLQTRDGFASKWFPLLYVGTNAAYMCLATPMGRLADRIGRAKVFVASHVALLGAYLCAAVVGGGTASTVATLALLGLFYAGTDGVLSALAGRLAGPAVRGSAIGTAQGVVAGSRMCASWLFGLAWFTLGRSPAMLLVAGLLAVAVPVAWRTLRPLDARLRTQAAA